MNFDLTQTLIDLTLQYGPKLILSVIVLFVGLKIIKLLTLTIEKILNKKDIDLTLRPFIISFSNVLLKVLLTISVLSMVGVEMTSFIAILGAAGLAIGMALSGTLQNFAGGVMILLFKPYKAGDYIEAQGFAGTVNEVQIFNTILKTPDNKTIIIPNGALSNSSLINYSTEKQRRVDWTFRISYGDDLNKAKELLKRFCEEDKRILTEPAPAILLSNLADSSVNISVRAWVNSSDYWNVLWDMNERVYKEFDSHNLNIPFPQMALHVHNK
ncbi:MAG: mechanosensitive ion channel domain-containing protein [Candidatus Kapaibacterium sp.]